MDDSPAGTQIANGVDAVALGEALLQHGTRELERLRRVRGAHQRTARRIRRALGVLALAAGLLGIPFASTGWAVPPAPCFDSPRFPWHELIDDPSIALADIDGDGDLDAFVGEQSGDTIFFENMGTAAAPDFAPPQTNPFGLADVGSGASPELADIDGDGDLDAFVGVSFGETIFFENTGNAAAPAFAAPQTSPFGLADVGQAASPALVDVDGDGDLDAFVGESLGNTIFFANTGAAAAPAFARSKKNPFGLGDVGREARPSLADIDGDGDLDAFVGEFYGDTIFFANTGTAAAPAFAAPQTSPFGLADGFYGSPALADIDADGDLDAFAENLPGQVFLLENTGTAAAPDFVAPGPFGLAEVGSSSYNASPDLADIDGDGDLDAFVGEVGGGRTIFFENTGAAAAPAFAAPQTSPFGLAGVGQSASPELADIDGDGDLDAFVGDWYGNTIFFENTGTAAAAAFAAPQTSPFGLADLGYAASPALSDIDDDGDLDAFVGEDLGMTIFFENTGTAAAPAFAAPQGNPFGLGDVGERASPELADIDGDDDLDAFVGEAGGRTIFFENTGTAAAPAFAAPQTSPFGLAQVRGIASPALADIDGDGDLDAFVGDFFGNTTFFESENDCPCGDGIITDFEQCDDGNTQDGDCCSSTCQYEAAASPCADPCVDAESCDGLGTCVGVPVVCAADADPCTQELCDPVHGCQSLAEPAAACDPAQYGSLRIKEDVPGRETLVVKMRDSNLLQRDLGDPLDPGGTAYTVCVYDEADAFVGSVEVDRAGQACGTENCWKPIGLPPPNGKGLLYKDSEASSDGIWQIRLKSGPGITLSAQVKGANNAAKGQLSLPVGLAAGLASSDSATVQLFASDASLRCSGLWVPVKRQWTGFFSGNK